MDACLVHSHLKWLEHFIKNEENLRHLSVLYSFINIYKNAGKSFLKRKEESRPLATKKIELPSCQHRFSDEWICLLPKIGELSPFDLISLSHAICRDPGFTMLPSWHLLLLFPRCITSPVGTRHPQLQLSLERLCRLWHSPKCAEVSLTFHKALWSLWTVSYCAVMCFIVHRISFS